MDLGKVEREGQYVQNTMYEIHKNLVKFKNIYIPRDGLFEVIPN